MKVRHCPFRSFMPLITGHRHVVLCVQLLVPLKALSSSPSHCLGCPPPPPHSTALVQGALVVTYYLRRLCWRSAILESKS
ncbi:uncharacterized protein B0J16DRAFT_339472 [Fusarium flagelliforme]|uniref:uncharacterized protein n=1 Tax=Fusarium flagelliforme TaxID=2675880 RepID=UPI001E8ECB67|nr:uncharacterized protein B0J16DRAFT_339472 [Fusarium flagelliforme]KAH7189375.1 hypothetical protein B0J16DRAFT_339472 [Fusarium flagelliforme]